MKEIIVPVIETDRFYLRQITVNDLNEWTRLKYADPDVMRYMPRRDDAPEIRAKKAFDFFNNIWAQHDYGAWLITDKNNGQMIGDCYLESGSESGSGEVELGYTIGREFWGQGVATEAGRAVVWFAFEYTDVQRILGVAMPDNIGSWRVLEYIGFSFERKDNLYNLDVLVYAINRDQFRKGDDLLRILDD